VNYGKWDMTRGELWSFWIHKAGTTKQAGLAEMRYPESRLYEKISAKHPESQTFCFNKAIEEYCILAVNIFEEVHILRGGTRNVILPSFTSYHVALFVV